MPDNVSEIGRDACVAVNAHILYLQWARSFGTSQIAITDALGQVVNTSSTSGTSIAIDVASLSQGIYLLSIHFGERKVQGRFIKQ